MTFQTYLLRLIIAGIANVATIGNLPVAVMEAMLLTPGLVTFVSMMFTAGYFWLVGIFIHD